ncbi:MAG TPA: diacylglycerol kinase family protein [Longimicrobiaceae bacterium]
MNSSAGRGLARWQPAVRSALLEAGVPALLRVIDPQRVRAEAAREAAAGAPVVAVGGGDGTVRAAAEALAGTGTALAVIPLGTLNHFARLVVGVGGIRAAVAALHRGQRGSAPVGIVDDHLFLCTATVGSYADAVRRRERLRPRWGRWIAAAVGFAAGLRRLRVLHVTLVTDDDRVECTTPLVWVRIAQPRAGRGAELEVVVPRRWERWSGLPLAVRLVVHVLRRRRVADHPALDAYRASHLVLDGRGRVGVTLDGEALTLSLPLWLSVQDRALQVIVPGEKGPPPAGDGGDALPPPPQSPG